MQPNIGTLVLRACCAMTHLDKSIRYEHHHHDHDEMAFDAHVREWIAG